MQHRLLGSYPENGNAPMEIFITTLSTSSLDSPYFFRNGFPLDSISSPLTNLNNFI